MYAKEEFIKFLPFVPAYLTCISSIKLIIYYIQFDVSIIEYLDISELLLLSLKDIFIFGIWFLFYPYFLFSLKVNEYTDRSINSGIQKLPSVLKRLLSSHSNKHKIYKYVPKKIIISVTFFTLFLLSNSNYEITGTIVYRITNYLDNLVNSKHEPSILRNIIFIPFIFLSFSLYALYNYLIEKINSILLLIQLPVILANVYRIYIYFFTGVLLVMIMTITFNVNYTQQKIEGNKLMVADKAKEQYLISGGDTLKLDSTYTIIGKTKEYYFYNRRKNNSDYTFIVPSSNEAKSYYYKQEKLQK